MPPRPGAAQAISAVRWTMAGSIAQRILVFISIAVVARVIGETEWGVYRQMLSVHMVLFVLLPLGFDQLYIREVASRSHFTLLLAGALNLTAIAVTVIGLAGHYIFADWMNLGPWSGMLWFLPVVVILQTRKLLYKTDLAARLNYRRISVGETLFGLVSAVGGIALVLVWPVAWSLYISYGLAEVAELLWLRRKKTIAFPSLGESLGTLRRDGLKWRRFGLYHCGTQVLNAAGSNSPVVILGAALSKAAAAAFSMGSLLVSVPIFIMIGALHRVTFSALAGRTLEQLKSPVLHILRLAAAFIVPVLVTVAVMAEPLIELALGESWVDSTAPVARMLSLYCVFMAMFSPISSLDVLTDRPDVGFYWNAVATPLRITAVVVGLKFGVTPAIMAYVGVSMVLWIAWGVLLARLLGVGQRRFHGAWLGYVPLWVLLGLLLWGVLVITDNPWIALPMAGVPLAIYAGLVAVLFPDTMRQAMRMLRR